MRRRRELQELGSVVNLALTEPAKLTKLGPEPELGAKWWEGEDPEGVGLG